MNIPFDRANFSKEMKPKISGVNVTLEYDNIESSLAKVSIDCSHILSLKLYDSICKDQASTNDELQATAKDYLQRAVLHFCISEHLIYMITRIGNDGVTVKKNEDETTIYKYQQDELQNKLISTGWFWMNCLLKLVNDNADEFPDWEGSYLTKLPVGTDDFARWVGVSDQYFIVVARWLIEEVWRDCVLSRKKEVEKNNSIARAVCYEVMGRACTVLAYMQLPEPVRKDVSNEMGKNHNAQADTYIREKVGQVYLRKAAAYWTQWEVELKEQEIKDDQKSRIDAPLFKDPEINENDSFCF